jgi:hypothetical protein
MLTSPVGPPAITRCSTSAAGIFEMDACLDAAQYLTCVLRRELVERRPIGRVGRDVVKPPLRVRLDDGREGCVSMGRRYGGYWQPQYDFAFARSRCCDFFKLAANREPRSPVVRVLGSMNPTCAAWLASLSRS